MNEPGSVFLLEVKKPDSSGSKDKIAAFLLGMPRSLFGFVQDNVGEVTEEHKRVLAVLEVIHIDEQVPECRRRFGRPRHSRKAMARAFLAKAVMGIPSTKALVHQLRVDRALREICGFWDGHVPSESVFSELFTALAKEGVLQVIHEKTVKAHFGEKVIGQAAIDSSSINGREKPLSKPKKLPSPRKKPGPRPKGSPPKEPTRLEVQLGQDWQTAAQELPKECDVGCKTNSKGHKASWIGFKLCAEVADCGAPLSIMLTSASVHDSQTAIPLMRMTAERTPLCFYHLMDKAFLAGLIQQAAKSLDRVALVQEMTPRGTTKIDNTHWFKTAEERRLESRTVVERFFSDLKENHGGACVRVRGWQKVLAHLMLGVLSILALVVVRLQT